MAGTNIELPGTRFIERPEEAEAAKSFRMAAEQGSVEAQYSLGVMYHEGGGGDRHGTGRAQPEMIEAADDAAFLVDGDDCW